jgi:hypothetical protein
MHKSINMYKNYICTIFTYIGSIFIILETREEKYNVFYLVIKLFKKKSRATLLRARARPRSPSLPWPPRSGKRDAASNASSARLPDDVSQGSGED